MCGIAGIIYRDGTHEVGRDMTRMLQSMSTAARTRRATRSTGRTTAAGHALQAGGREHAA